MSPQGDRPHGVEGFIRYEYADREAIWDESRGLYWFKAFGKWYGAKRSAFLEGRWHAKGEPWQR